MKKEEKKTSPIGIINLSQQSRIEFPKISKNSRGWVDYGRNNLFPQEIIQLNADSAVNNAILESKVTYICGKGIKNEYDVGKNRRDIGRPNPGNTWDDILENIAKDYVLFGGFALQVIKNKDAKSISVYHQDFGMVRAGLPDDDGKVNSYFLSYDWSRIFGKHKPIELSAWESIEAAAVGQAYLFYYSDYKAGLRFYPIPSYYSAMPYLKADGALARFYLNAINNNFTPSVIISLPTNPSPEEKRAIEKGIADKWGSADNANRVLVMYGENNGVMPSVKSFDASKNADLYNNIESIIFQKIISSHRLSSPTLAGVSGGGSLSGNAGELVSSFILYNYSVIEQLRRKLLDALNIFSVINQTACLRVEELDVVDRISEAESRSRIYRRENN